MAQAQRSESVSGGARRQAGNVSAAGSAQEEPRQHCEKRNSNGETGEGGIRTRETGINPFDGLANRLESDVSDCNSTTYESVEENLAFYLALLSEKSPDLALIVDSWEALSEPVRAGIITMVKVAKQ